MIQPPNMCSTDTDPSDTTYSSDTDLSSISLLTAHLPI